MALKPRFMSQDLAHKLKQELEFETEAPKDMSFIEAFKAKNVWKVTFCLLKFQIQDTPGSKEFVLKRTFGNEQISLMVIYF